MTINLSADVTDNRLSTVADMNMLNSQELRSAVPESAQDFNFGPVAHGFVILYATVMPSTGWARGGAVRRHLQSLFRPGNPLKPRWRCSSPAGAACICRCRRRGRGRYAVVALSWRSARWTRRKWSARGCLRRCRRSSHAACRSSGSNRRASTRYATSCPR